LSLDSNDTNVIDALADVLLQMGNHDEALKLLLTSTSIDPEANPFKWLYLAQLQSSFDSLASYLKAIELLQESARSRSDEAQVSDTSKAGDENIFLIALFSGHISQVVALRKQISKAHCSIAELYMTDLCYEENAEVECEAAINKAISTYPDSLDGQQALVNLRISQCRTEEACAIIEEVYTKVMSIRDKIAARTVMEEMAADTPEPEEITGEK
jgi:tetratricopeptide (TPR) repeat protein